MRLTVFISPVVAVAMVAAGCGAGGGTAGGDGTSATSGSTAGTTAEAEGKGEEGGEEKEAEGKQSSTQAALIKSGDAICSKVPERYGKKLAALEKKSGKKKLSTEEANLKAAVPPLYLAVEEFEELTAPSGEEEDLEAMVAALEAAAKGLEAKPESALSGPKSPFVEFQKLTQEYGFKVCSQL